VLTQGICKQIGPIQGGDRLEIVRAKDQDVLRLSQQSFSHQAYAAFRNFLPLSTGIALV